MLFAPKAGSELRNQLSEQAGNLANQAQDGIRKVTENAGDWADRGRDMYGKAKDAVAKGADEAQKYVRDNAGSMQAVAKGADGAEVARRHRSGRRRQHPCATTDQQRSNGRGRARRRLACAARAAPRADRRGSRARVGGRTPGSSPTGGTRRS